MTNRSEILPSGHRVAEKYAVRRLMGEGGMGAVYEAQNVWTQRRVALKVLRRDLAENAELVRRFVREGRSATMIAHPNVVEVLDMGQDPSDGLLYMVQEYLTGTGLDRLLATRGRLAVRDALDIAVPVMAGLAAAHHRGVVHRDIKPANILLAQTMRGTITPKVIDFGVAKLLVSSSDQYTKPGLVMGTPHYMSPEQLRGMATVDHRTDVWSMGVLLYEMLSGQRPFEGVGLSKIAVSITAGKAQPLGTLVPDMPATLAAAVHRALGALPDERHASMEAFLDAVLACPELEPLSRWLSERHAEAMPHQRRHPRYAATWRCDVRCSSWDKVRDLVSSNVSRGGVFLASTTPPPVQTAVELTLRLPDGSPLRLRGVVARLISAGAAAPTGGVAGFAVRFDDEHANDLVVLEQVAAAHQGPGYEALPELPTPGVLPRPVADDADAAPVKPPPAPAKTKPRASAPSRKELAEGVGIDFGTTYSSVTVAFGDKVYMIADAKQRGLHPSVVCYPDRTTTLVGWDARQRQIDEPGRTVSSVKRLLGRSYDEPTLQGYLATLPYPTSRGPGDHVLLQIGETEISPVQVAAEIIDLLRRIAEQRMGRAVRKAVFAVPLTFSEAQSQALCRAASMAGVEALELIGEPIAAVLAYGFGQHKQEVVAVYDFGGGTFDFSVVRLHGNRYEVLASGGDAWLGGEDVDLALANEAANRFWRETRLDLRQRSVEWQRLLFASEQSKRQLSSQVEAELVVERAIERPQPRDLQWKLSQADLEQLCGEVVGRSLDVCGETLRQAGLRVDQVDRVVITGGTSRIPFVQRQLSAHFRREVAPLVDPELSVCIGAGLRAAVLTKHRVKEGARREGASV